MNRNQILLLAMLVSEIGQASPSEAEMKEVFIKLANPVSDLAALPLQYNFNFKDGDSTRSVFNIQPFFAAKTERLNIVNRFVASQVATETTDAAGTTVTASGFGDFNYQVYFTPRQDSAVGVTMGAGVMLVAPTGIDDSIGSGKWGAGPTAVILSSSESWSLGGLIYQNWSIAGDKDRKDVNLLTIQPICTYRLGNLWSIVPLNNITYDATLNGEKWTVPVGLQVTKLLPSDHVPFNIMVGAFSNVVRPDNAPDWTLKFQMTMIL